MNVAPTTQLQHGEEYTLQTPTRIPSLWPVAVGALFQLQLTTLNNLQANADPSPGVAAPGQTVQLLATGSLSILTEFGVTPNLFRFIFTGSGSTPSDELQFFPGNGVIAPGTYTNANTTGGQPFFLLSLPLQCANSDLPNWQFTIYEAQAAGDGTAAKFSADFEQSCPAGVPTPFIGSVRVNSTVPLP